MNSAATILIVDDSLVIRAVVRGWLEEQGYQVVEADDGVAGVERCLALLPDVVLLDIELPRLNGHEVLARLKAEPTVKDIPVVFLTKRNGMDDVLRGLTEGAHDFLSKPFDPSELVARVGAAVRVKKLQDELHRRNVELDMLSRTDMLTGLFNRRHMDEQLRAAIKTARRHGQEIGLLLLDVDHFKTVNDTYGHAGGDAVLRELARRIKGELRAGDVAGRWGGEEFLVLLPQVGLDGAIEAGERVRTVVAARPFDAAGQVINVTVSGGCSAGLGPSAEELVHQADTGLYRAKDGGRNRIVAAFGADHDQSVAHTPRRSSLGSDQI
jgi:diguanylate cyclase (GGDEF)-like protein